MVVSMSCVVVSISVGDVRMTPVVVRVSVHDISVTIGVPDVRMVSMSIYMPGVRVRIGISNV